MKKFVVMVNGKYMTKVEAEGACSAEHFFLDEIRDGINAAQAFDEKEVKGEYFLNLMMNWCEFKSIEEIKAMSEVFKTEHDSKVEAETAQYEKMIDDAKDAMKRAEDYIEESFGAIAALRKMGEDRTADYIVKRVETSKKDIEFYKNFINEKNKMHYTKMAELREEQI